MAASLFVVAVDVFLAAGIAFWLLYFVVVVPVLRQLSRGDGPDRPNLLKRWPSAQLQRYRRSLSRAEVRRPLNWYLSHADVVLLIAAGCAIVSGALMSVGR